MCARICPVLVYYFSVLGLYLCDILFQSCMFNVKKSDYEKHEAKYLFVVCVYAGSVMACRLHIRKERESPCRETLYRITIEVVVVSESKHWKSVLGERLRDELEKTYPVLPQREATSRISYCEPYHFNGLMRYVRNILLVDIMIRFIPERNWLQRMMSGQVPNWSCVFNRRHRWM